MERVEAREEWYPAGHPLKTLTEEHKLLLGFAAELRSAADEFGMAGSLQAAGPAVKELNRLFRLLKDSASHYLREENVLFPCLSKHEVTGPPQMMWAEHNQIRALEKDIFGLLETPPDLAFIPLAQRLRARAQQLVELLTTHFHKENTILFPMARKTLSDGEWTEVKAQFQEIGYCSFTPRAEIGEQAPAATFFADSVSLGMIDLGTGNMTVEELIAFMNTLPVDVTFVDAEDRVRYFNQAQERIFPRTKTVIGRTVQQCHPQKSVAAVNKILDDFRNGRREPAEFWLQLQGKLVHIRYFSIHDNAGQYIGCLEVSQDVTHIQELKGEKRLL